MKTGSLRKRKRIIRWGAAFLVLLMGIWIVWGNITVGATIIEIQNNGIPAAFAGFKIAQISDFHNAQFGKNNIKIVKILKENQPDMIVLTGDLVDSNRTDVDRAVSFVKQAAEIAPCYYVTGNHEAWIGEQYDALEKQLEECGVMILHNQTVQIEKEAQCIQLAGIDDPDFAGIFNGLYGKEAEVIANEIAKAGVGGGYRILLSHRPEALETYAEEGMDLVLCGHAHGGQFRLPFVGGLVAPNQGLFPEYDSGVYKKDPATMVVSRGVGNSIIPVRFYNRPEIVFVVLRP